MSESIDRREDLPPALAAFTDVQLSIIDAVEGKESGCDKLHATAVAHVASLMGDARYHPVIHQSIGPEGIEVVDILLNGFRSGRGATPVVS